MSGTFNAVKLQVSSGRIPVSGGLHTELSCHLTVPQSVPYSCKSLKFDVAYEKMVFLSNHRNATEAEDDNLTISKFSLLRKPK